MKAAVTGTVDRYESDGQRHYVVIDIGEQGCDLAQDQPVTVHATERTDGYRIAARPYHEDGTDPDRMDDVVVNDVDMFRLEQMDAKSWWACCYLAGQPPENRIAFDIRWVPKLREVVVTVNEWPQNVRYEGEPE